MLLESSKTTQFLTNSYGTKSTSLCGEFIEKNHSIFSNTDIVLGQNNLLFKTIIYICQDRSVEMKSKPM